MYKKILFVFFSFFILVFSPVGRVYAADSNITSKMYGSQYKDSISFSIKECTKDYKRLNVEVKEVSIDEYKSKDESGFKGLFGKFMNIVNNMFFSIANVLNNLIFGVSCTLGFAPSQLLQLMFMPIVLDDLSFLDAMSLSIRTIAIVVLTIMTVISVLEIRKMDGSVGQEILQKMGFVLISAGIIAFSKFILQGIFDIANVLGYYVSHYRVEIQMIGDHGKVGVNILEIPSVFASFLDYAFKPDALTTLMGFNSLMLGILSVVKILILIFMTKDLLKIAVYGIKRMITLVSAPIVLPIVAGLYPSFRTRDIFNNYFKMVISSAFAPVLFGVIYLASAPFVMENLTGMIEAPLLKVLVLAFYINIISSIPEMVDGLIGSSNPIGNKRFERGVQSMKHGTLGQAGKNIGNAKSNLQTINNLRANHMPKGTSFGTATKKYAKNRLLYGVRKR